MKKIGVGLIGCGSMGRELARLSALRIVHGRRSIGQPIGSRQ